MRVADAVRPHDGVVFVPIVMPFHYVFDYFVRAATETWSMPTAIPLPDLEKGR